MSNNEFKLGAFAIACVSIIAILALTVTTAFGQARVYQTDANLTANGKYIVTTWSDGSKSFERVDAKPWEKYSEAELNLGQDTRNLVYAGVILGAGVFTSQVGLSSRVVGFAAITSVYATFDNVRTIIRRHKVIKRKK